MKALLMCFLLFFHWNIYSQVIDDFSDLNFSVNPTWIGDSSHFIINDKAELQSNASDVSESNLLTKSKALVNAHWELTVKINYSTSSSNYARVYLSIDSIDLENGFNGYFVQLGGTEDEISLYLSKGNEIIKLIDGIDKSLDGKASQTKLRVQTDSIMNFGLWRKTLNDSDYVFEGQVHNQDFFQGEYFGVGFSNTKSTGRLYSFDGIGVKGDKFDNQVFERMVERKQWYSLSSEILYPDSKANNSSLRIYFSLDDSSYSSQIRIFNSSGETVRIITENDLINSNSSLVWCGEDEDGKLLNSGIYIVHAKLFNLKNGNIKVFKEAIALVRF